jgi:hypothetical protein
MSPKRNSILTASVLMAAAFSLYAQTVPAADCTPIMNAMNATLNASGIRQYLFIPGHSERLMSITSGDTVYLAMGPGRWSKMSRKEVKQTAKEAEGEHTYSGCQSLGSESVNGVASIVYQYANEIRGKGPIQGKVWIGADGLLRKQEAARGAFMRYEYDNVKAPIP